MVSLETKQAGVVAAPTAWAFQDEINNDGSMLPWNLRLCQQAEVLCSAASTAELLTILSAASTSATQALLQWSSTQSCYSRLQLLTLLMIVQFHPLDSLDPVSAPCCCKCVRCEAPPTNGHVKLPKGHLAVVAGCNGDIWEAPKGRSSEDFSCCNQRTALVAGSNSSRKVEREDQGQTMEL